MATGDETYSFAGAGAQIGFWVLGIAGCRACELDRDVGPFNLVTGAILGAALGAGIGALIGFPIARAGREENERIRREHQAAEAAELRTNALRRLGALNNDAQGVALRLPVLLGEAELCLDKAEDEWSGGLYSPFWEAIEEASVKLSTFSQNIALIEERRRRYLSDAIGFGEAPKFGLGGMILPDPGATHARLVQLYRKAQANPHFAMVYEQRRTTAVLIEGFRSLGQAIEHLGDRVTAEIRSLSSSLDCRLASIQTSLESAARSAAEQNAAITAELRGIRQSDAQAIDQLRSASDDRRATLRMLDNIQRKRKPAAWEKDHRSL